MIQHSTDSGGGLPSRDCNITVVVVGQPSTGKSTFFTRATGKIARIASWPGTTVEQGVAKVTYEGLSICLVDLPGIYGLAVTSPEEAITKEFLLRGSYDVVLVLVDPLVIERSIYLPIQLVEAGLRVVVAITKWDVVHKHGIHIDVDGLSHRIGAPVIPISSLTGEGLRELIATLVSAARDKLRGGHIKVDYGPLNTYIDSLAPRVRTSRNPRLLPRWVALRLLEGDDDLVKFLDDVAPAELAKVLREEFKRTYRVYPEDVAVYSRYRKASEILDGVVVRVQARAGRLVDMLDRVFLSEYLGPIASLAVMFLVFLLAFTVNIGFPLNLVMRLAGHEELAELLESYSLSGLVAEAVSLLSNLLRSWLSSYSESIAVVVDGVVGSVGLVLSFAPLVLVVSALISVLEDSGLGPRMVFSLHRFLSKFGLSGRSLYPMVLGFGCNVPAVLQTRILIDSYERLQVIASVPFILCQARLVVMMYFTQYIFPGIPLLQSLLMLALYITSILLFLLTSKLLRSTMLRIRESPELVMEIPPLHRPSSRVVWWNSWIRVKHFLVKAGTIIFALAIASWIMVSLGPGGFVENPENSYAAIIGATIGRFVGSVYGIGEDSSWKVGYAILYGTIAKEGLITSVAQLAAVREGEVLGVLGLTYEQSVGLLFFFMFYIPCLPTIAVIYQESRSLKFTVSIVAYNVIIALSISAAIYYLLVLLN